MRDSDCWPVCWEPVKSLTAFAMASWCNRTEWRKSGVSGGRGSKNLLYGLEKPSWEFSHRARPKPVAGRQVPRMGQRSARRRSL